MDRERERLRSPYKFVAKKSAGRAETLAQLTSQLRELNSYREIGEIVGRGEEAVRRRVRDTKEWRESVVGGPGKHKLLRHVAEEVVQSFVPRL